MGYFLAVAAFKTDSVADLARVVTDHMKSYGVPCESVPVDSQLDPQHDAQIYAPVADWTVILWPAYFNIHDFPLVRTLAASQGWLVSTVHVYDDEYWEHLCCSGGTELHTFCSRSRFWEEESPDDFQRMSGYDTEPSRLASPLVFHRRSFSHTSLTLTRYLLPRQRRIPRTSSRLEIFGSLWIFGDAWASLIRHHHRTSQRYYDLGSMLERNYQWANKGAAADRRCMTFGRYGCAA